MVVLAVDVFCCGARLIPSPQPPLLIGTELLVVALATPGNWRRVASSSPMAAHALKPAPNPELPTVKVSASLTPLGRLMRSMRWLMVDSELQTMARVIATCTPLRIIETLLRIRAEKMGRSSVAKCRDWGLGIGDSRERYSVG